MVHRKIGKTLAKIDGIVFCGQPTHYGEDGGAYVGEFGIDVQYRKFKNKKIASNSKKLR
jgi:hypothetical protein